MSRFVTIDENEIWKFGALSDGSVDGLFHLHELTGAGEHSFCVASDSGKEWTSVNPMEERFDGEGLIIRQSDIDSLKEYLNNHSPKISFLSKLFGGKDKKSDLLLLVDALIKHSKNKDRAEYLSWL